MPFLTFITTCRSRLSHLQQSLPTFVAQADAAWVVVDYDCPERSGDWVEQGFPEVKVVRATDRPRFELSRARNLGAAVAESPWLCFIDADVLLAPDFAAQVRPVLAPGHYYQAKPRMIETWGTSICARDDFERVGGYDEVLQGWGKDDDDFYGRLVLAGVSYATFPGELISAISHDDSERVASYDVRTGG
jgi:predicted glycosyltransferase involved in capsule biosynthesis